MFFKSYLPKQYLAAAIVASLLQGVVTARVPVAGCCDRCSRVCGTGREN